MTISLSSLIPACSPAVATPQLSPAFSTLLVDHVTLSALFLILGRRSFIACETWQSKKIVREACSFQWIKRCGGDLSKCTIRLLWLYYLAMEFKDARACTMPSYTYIYIYSTTHACTYTNTHAQYITLALLYFYLHCNHQHHLYSHTQFSTIEHNSWNTYI